MDRQPRALQGRAHHLQGLRAFQLVLGPGSQGLLLAPFLLAPARPEFRQSAGAQGGAARPGLLAGHGRGRLAFGRHPLPLRARGHQLREPSGDVRLPQAYPRPCGQALQGPHAAGRGQPVARGRRGILRRRRLLPHGLPLPGHAAHVHVLADGGPLPHHRHTEPDAGDTGQCPMGAVFAQSRRADAGDGHGRGARLHVPHVRARETGAHQLGHTPQTCAATGERPAQDRAHECHAADLAGIAGDLLRRRTGHGRQLLSWRPRRRAHTHAVVGRPQCGLLHGQPATVVPAHRH